jgi:urease accessory protein
MTPLALVRLLQLASPALPVGAYTYSQGLEWAVESAAVRDEDSAGGWLAAQLEFGIGSFELPMLARCMDAWAAGDLQRVAEVNALFLASRETVELRAETLQMGYSLVRLLRELGESGAGPAGPDALDQPAFPVVWAHAAVLWTVPAAEAAAAYAWAWLENQAMAAIKLVPLGQSAGQRLLARLGGRIPEIAARAFELPEARWSNFAPGLAIASSRHETQYSRLFRS